MEDYRERIFHLMDLIRDAYNNPSEELAKQVQKEMDACRIERVIIDYGREYVTVADDDGKRKALVPKHFYVTGKLIPFTWQIEPMEFEFPVRMWKE